MDYKSLGHTGLKVSVVGVGCNNFGTRCDEGASAGVVHAALECGINFFDTADVYGDHLSEEYLGAAIKGMDRSQIIIATKFAAPMGDGALNRGASRHHVMKAVEASLKRLGTDYIDLYQIHWPNRGVPIAETMGAMESLVDQGLVKYVGVSNFNLEELQEAQNAMSRNPIVSNQVLYSLIDREIEGRLLPYCQEQDITILAYTPLADGSLAGKSRFPGRNSSGIKALEAVAAEAGKTLAQVALNWCTSRPNVIAIPKSDRVDRTLENCGASGWRLSSNQVKTLDAAFSTR